MRPGITDEATIVYRNEEEVLAALSDPEQGYVDEVLPTKIAMYRAYVAAPSLGKDLSILVRTLGRIVWP